MRWLSGILCVLVLLPLIWLPWSWLAPLNAGAQAAWEHTLEYTLPSYGLNTLLLALLVAVFSGAAGVACAWCVTVYRFPCRRFLNFALVVPLAVPAYIAASVYGWVTGAFGPLAGFVPVVQGLWGSAFVLALATFPYTFLLSRTAFATQPPAWREASHSLGHGELAYFFRVALPAARPFWAMGMTLAVMETVADIGTVQILGLPTLASGVYRTWFVMGEPMVAARIAFLLLALALAVIVMERLERLQARYAAQAKAEKYVVRLRGWRGVAIGALCGMPFLLGFVLPVIYLVWLNHYRANGVEWLAVFSHGWDSLRVAVLTGVACVMAALGLHFSERLHGGMHRLAHLSAYIGYAVPGVAVAVGLLFVSQAAREYVGIHWLTGSLFAVCAACFVRFLATGMGSVHAGYERIPAELDQAASALGAGAWRMFRQIHLPLMLAPLMAAFLVVVVDALKELPATLILRPFDMRTLAIATYELASDDRAADASPYALSLIGVVTLCVLALHKLQGRMVRRARG